MSYEVFFNSNHGFDIKFNGDIIEDAHVKSIGFEEVDVHRIGGVVKELVRGSGTATIRLKDGKLIDKVPLRVKD